MEIIWMIGYYLTEDCLQLRRGVKINIDNIPVGVGKGLGNYIFVDYVGR